MQNEGLSTFHLDEPREVRLLDRRVDVRILVVLEHPKVPIQPHVHTGRLNHLDVVRFDFHMAGLDLSLEIPIGEQHTEKLQVEGPLA